MSKNNLFETSKQLYYRFGEIDDYESQMLEVRQFIQDNPISNHEINQYEENIKQLLFLRELINQEGFLKVLNKMRRLRVSIIWLKRDLKLHELAVSFDFFLVCLNKMMKYYCFQKILNLLTSDPTQTPEEFIASFQDASTLPIDELTGYKSYSNPHLMMSAQDEIYFLHDLMSQESDEVRETMKQHCLNAYFQNCNLDLWEYFKMIDNHASRDVNIFSLTFKKCILQIFKAYKKKTKSRSLKPDPFEYYGSLAVF